MGKNWLTPRFKDAFAYAFDLHAQQTRKGASVPYISHLMSVAALVMENDGDEDMAIAALLHDAVEDQGGLETLQAIRARFGERVARIVDGCSDTYVFPKPPWRARKEQYLLHLQTAGEDVLSVSLADKIHNARSILFDLQKDGAPVWRRFSGGKDGTLWYYRSLADFYVERMPGALSQELERVVTALEQYR